jgi:hypothetical protein
LRLLLVVAGFISGWWHRLIVLRGRALDGAVPGGTSKATWLVVWRRRGTWCKGLIITWRRRLSAWGRRWHLAFNRFPICIIELHVLDVEAIGIVWLKCGESAFSSHFKHAHATRRERNINHRSLTSIIEQNTWPFSALIFLEWA